MPYIPVGSARPATPVSLILGVIRSDTRHPRGCLGSLREQFQHFENCEIFDSKIKTLMILLLKPYVTRTGY